MAIPGQNVVYESESETVEVARNALELTRPALVSDRLITTLLDEKVGNPIAGMMGMHLLLEAQERQRSPKSALTGRELAIRDSLLERAPALLDEAFRNLERLLSCGPNGKIRDPSDVIALKVRAGRLDPNQQVVVTEPPMLWVSWAAVRGAAGIDQQVEVAPDLWRRIAWGNAWGPYLAWPPRETTLDAFVNMHLVNVPAGVQEGATFQNLTARYPTVANAGFRSASSMALTSLEGSDLTRALGIPLSVIKSVM